MRRQLLSSVLTILVFTLVLGLLYPLVFTGVAQVAFHDKANGSLVEQDGKVVGSRWIGQPFTKPEYFHPRPSADGYVPGAQGGGTYSYGSNYGPTNPALIGNVPGVSIDGKNEFATPTDPYCVPVPSTDEDDNAITDAKGNPVYDKNKDGTYVCNPDTVFERVLAYRAENGLAKDASVPVDAVTATGSGLDPHISVANARLQVARVAKARKMSVRDVRKLVDEHTDGRGLGFLGEPGVNVLELNLALDRAGH
jgi:K+-transporting ATPase ATPase C chain